MTDEEAVPSVRRWATRAPRVLAGLLALLLVAAACGQKPNVHAEGARDLPDIIIETSGAGFAPGDPDDPAGGLPDDTGNGAATGQPTPGATGDAGDAPEGGTGGDPGPETGEAELALSGSNRTGVSDDTLRVAVHAPVTGAAPLPAVAFERARDLYWRYVTETQGETVLGRSNVEVAFRDDRYTPSSAVQVCRELAANSFLLVGGGGTDQIQACAQFANQAGVPYLSSGVTEAGLANLDWYFAASMTYRQQGALLAAYVKRNLDGRKVAAIVTDTGNFDDAVQGWEDGVGRQGLDYFQTRRHPRGNDAWINSYISDLDSAGVEVLYMLTAPSDYIQFAQQAASRGYNPQYIGVGVSMGLNAVLNSGCPHVDGGIFFSPFPGLDWARQNEPEFFQAGDDFGVPVDDLGLALWGLAKNLHEAFKRYEATFASTDLTREDFRTMLERQQGIQTGVFPQLSYSPDDHFGASQVHVVQGDCNVGESGEHVTLETFASGF